MSRFLQGKFSGSVVEFVGFERARECSGVVLLVVFNLRKTRSKQQT